MPDFSRISRHNGDADLLWRSRRTKLGGDGQNSFGWIVPFGFAFDLDGYHVFDVQLSSDYNPSARAPRSSEGSIA